jgi:hypothetical protein
MTQNYLDSMFLTEGDDHMATNFNRFSYMWQNGAISNADYLLLVNFEGNRSFNDGTQYPVFPWVISDYKNETINLSEGSNSYRDLGTPVASLWQDKLEASRSKYFEIIAKNPKSSPFLRKAEPEQEEEEVDEAYMHMSHYSTAGIALYYLIRKFPSLLVRL